MRTSNSRLDVDSQRSRFRRGAAWAGCLLVMLLAGCETNSWFDPSRTGYFQKTPTSIAVLKRLDVIERAPAPLPALSQPTSEDLEPGDLEYRLSPGDQVRIEIFELVSQGQTDVALRLIDPSGNIRLPTIGEIPAAGLTISQLQDLIEDRLRGLITDPIVSIVLERGQGFTFTVYGAIGQPGVYGLTKPDFRLVEALSLAGGPFFVTEDIFVIRSQPLDDKFRPIYGDRGVRSPTPPMPEGSTEPAVDIDELINRLEQRTPNGPSGGPSPGALSARQDAPPPVDIDDLVNPQPSRPSARPGQAPPQAGGSAAGWTWDPIGQTWMQTGPGPNSGPMPPKSGGSASAAAPSFASRVISINYPALAKGDPNLNIVVRPGDQIYVVPPTEGVVYIDGEIIRPGVYELPRTGDLTLSRLIAAAGGLGQLAIPSRVDLVRRLESGREAVVRVNLGAIRNRAEPDIMLKPDDHIIIGTNFFAYPLAVIRNGFRMTYGFGFLLDRNFGNDVFGPPPGSLTVN